MEFVCFAYLTRVSQLWDTKFGFVQVITQQSLLSTGVVIEEDYLRVGWIIDFMSSRIVAW